MRGFDPKPVTLEGEHVRLEPLAESHAIGLYEAGRDAGVWRYLPLPGFRSLDGARAWIDAVNREVAGGSRVAFAIVERGAGRAVGSTSFLDIRREHRALEIGWTWLGSRHQRTAVNTECKLLLLGHAFDELGALRVQFKTDSRNERSQRALERIGAVREGVLRRHMVLPDGYERDSVYYGIVDSEWPGVRSHLRELMRRA
jgi:RimJ/RimL family protein N-acetyltransferase